MKLAILHYHLNRGGVARVIENQLVALDAVLDGARPWEVAILYGGRREGWNEALSTRLRNIWLRLCEVPGLEYDTLPPAEAPPEPAPRLDAPEMRPEAASAGRCSEPRRSTAREVPALDPAPSARSAPSEPRRIAAREVPKTGAGAGESAHRGTAARALYEQIIAALDGLGFAPAETLLHIHNHSLGKNRALPAAVWQLAEAGYALLLQIHDFAEDFRPANYRRLGELAPGRLYPQSPAVHYAVLTSRDRRILVEAGVPAERVHRLPNPVLGLAEPAERPSARARLAEQFGIGPDKPLLLYPVRCIRRKNIGEALLVSLMAPPGTIVGLTLPPLNPAEQPGYQRWKQTAAEAELPCVFELGVPGALSFAENLAAADRILTTSLAEGFGMVYLESWLAGRPLAGRDLPEVTEDFVQAGVNLADLWQRLPVPIEWIDRQQFRERLLSAYKQTMAAFGRDANPEALAQLEHKLAGAGVDFGDLDEPAQCAVIRRAKNRQGREQLAARAPGLERCLGDWQPDTAERIAANAHAIRAAYGLVPSGRRLAACYQRVAAERRGGPIAGLARPEHILERFLSAARFRLIRT